MIRFSLDQYFSQTQYNYFIFKKQRLFIRLRNTHNPSSYNDALLLLRLPLYTRIGRFLISLLIHDHLFHDSADRTRNVFASMPFLHVVTFVSTSFTVVECYLLVRRCWKIIAESLDKLLPSSSHQPDKFPFTKRSFG